MEIVYQAKFEVRKNESTNRPVDEIFIKQVGQWLQSKYRSQTDAKIFTTWLYEGGFWSHKLPFVDVNTEVFSPTNNPSKKLWGFKLKHPDSKHRYRTWITEAILELKGDGGALAYIVNGYYLNPGYIGEPLPRPEPFPPNLVSQLFNHKHLELWTNGHQLKSTPKVLKVGDGKAFVELLVDENRQYPIVMVNQSRNWGVNLKNLQKKTLGKAEIYGLKDPEILEEMKYFWKGDFENYRCLRDSIRVYLPRIFSENPRDYRRHRYFKFEDYESNPRKALEIVSKGLMRNAYISRDSKILTFDDILQRKRLERIYILKNAGDSKAAEIEELTNLLYEEADKLRERLKSSEDEKNKILKQKEDLEIDNEIIEERYSQLEKGFESLQKNLQLNQKNTPVDDLAIHLKNLPDSLEAVVLLAEKAFPRRLVFLEEAKRSARKAKFDNIYIAWAATYCVANTLHDLYFSKDGVDIEKEFKKETTFTFKKTESAATKQDKALAKSRMRKYMEQEVQIYPHVSYSKGNKHLRIHIYVDEVNKLIVIGHFGNHLTTAGTNRRKEG